MPKEFIVHLAEFEISKTDLERMADSEIAFLATLAFAVDEKSVFQKLLVQTFNAKPKSNEMLQNFQLQQNVIMRTLNAKVFEAISIFEHYQRIVEREKDHDRVKKLDEFQQELDLLKVGPTYELAKVLRDELTNHYLTSVTKKILIMFRINRDF